ncbi:insulinase family protein [Pseudomonas anatoliensis]|uniref:M16 family metallopeptidase n=1 Tax=Pseudomonas anatoliensis TaxID=2710589 RepID=UPI001B3223D1|nr:insulinase family protein [Pseudomonas anatoliensis]
MHAKSESTSETTVPTTPEITPGDNSSPDRTLQSLAELEGKVPSSRTLDVQTWNTVEGAKVMFLAAPELPMFDLKLTFAAGSSRDGDAGGLAILTNGLLNEGVADKDAGQIADVFESVGASFKNGVENDTAVASLRSLSALDKREPVLAMFAELTGKPTFPDDAVLHIKDQVLARVNYFKQNPDAQANAELLKRVYGNHPYTTSKYGTAQSVAAITRSQIKAFHEKAYAAGNAVIALVGDLSREDAEAIAAQVSSSLPKGPALTKIEQPVQHEASTVHLEFPTKQTILRLSQLGVERDDPDYAAVVMGNWILGSGPGSRLTTEVRERRGLTYDVRSSLELLQVRGRFLIELKTRADVSEATLQLVKDVIASFLENGPTEKELAEVKRERTGRLLRSAASNASIVNKLAGIGFRNGSLSEDEDFIRQIQSLTVEQVKTAMNKHLSLDEMVIVTAGPTVPQKPLPAPIAEPAAQ